MDINKTINYSVFKRELNLFLKLGKEVAETNTYSKKIKRFEATDVLSKEKISFNIWETEKNILKI